MGNFFSEQSQLSITTRAPCNSPQLPIVKDETIDFLMRVERKFSVIPANMINPLWWDKYNTIHIPNASAWKLRVKIMEAISEMEDFQSKSTAVSNVIQMTEKNYTDTPVKININIIQIEGKLFVEFHRLSGCSFRSSNAFKRFKALMLNEPEPCLNQIPVLLDDDIQEILNTNS